MSFEIRLLIVALVAFACANLFISGVVAALWTRLTRGEAGVRARRLAWLRALPTFAGVAAGLWGATTFLLFEARDQEETFGTVLSGLAVVPAILVAAAAARGLRSMIHAWTIRQRWLATAEPIRLNGCALPAWTIESAFPVVARLARVLLVSCA